MEVLLGDLNFDKNAATYKKTVVEEEQSQENNMK